MPLAPPVMTATCPLSIRNANPSAQSRAISTRAFAHSHCA